MICAKGQGNRILFGTENASQIVFIPSGLESLRPDAALRRLFSLDQVQGLRRRTAMFCGALPVRIRLSSSRNVTSSTQCTRFSTCQC